MKQLQQNMHTDLRQTLQDEPFFFHMSRCVLISPLCREHQNARPREQLVSNNQNQTSRFFSPEERADADECTLTPF